jgi:flagellar protein FlaG
MDRGQVLQREQASTRRSDTNGVQAAANNPTKAAEADRQKAEQLRAFVANDKFSISTYHDEGSGRQIVEVRDQDTGDVVSQYPSEELRRLYESLRESLVDQQA